MLSVMGAIYLIIIDKPLIYGWRDEDIGVGGNFSIFKSIFLLCRGNIYGCRLILCC